MDIPGSVDSFTQDLTTFYVKFYCFLDIWCFHLLLFIEINSDSEDMKYMLIAPNNRKNIYFITVKELQVTLKNALKQTEALDVKNK
jgi:hypothetical protein